MAKFKIGDKVELKSGGPAMTINAIYTGSMSYDCVWLVKDVLKTGTFSEDAIQVPSPPPAPIKK